MGALGRGLCPRGTRRRSPYGRTRAWTPTQTSVTPISELLFGEFDDVRGTDAVAVRNGKWSYSSAAIQKWARLNAKLADPFANAVAADFDGNGRSDIAFGGGKRWRYSRDGRSALGVLREGQTSQALNQLLVGRFDRGRRAQVIGFSTTLVVRPGDPVVIRRPGEKLVIWRGLGSGDAFRVAPGRTCAEQMGGCPAREAR